MKIRSFLRKTTVYLLGITCFLTFLPVQNINAAVPVSTNIHKDQPPPLKISNLVNPANSSGPLIQPGDEVQVTLKLDGAPATYRDWADIVLVMDLSGSMNDSWCVDKKPGGGCITSERKIVSARRAMIDFVDNTVMDVPATGIKGDYVGLVTYNGDSCSPTSKCARVNFGIANMTPANQATLKMIINGLVAGNRTPIGSGMDIANQELLNLTYPASTARPNIGPGAVPKHMVIATDGLQTVRPTPYELSILKDSIDNKIAVYTVGIGDDIGTYPAVTGSDFNPCTGCLYGSTIPDPWFVSGDMIMRDLACRADVNDPDPKNNCELDLAKSDGDPKTNDINSPRNYFFAPTASDLRLIYQRVINRIYGNIWYTVIDAINQNVFQQNIHDFIVVDCNAPANPWPYQVKSDFDNLFLLTVESIPAGEAACIKFKINILNANDLVRDVDDYDGDLDKAEMVKFGDTLNLSGKRDFAIDNATLRNASPWPPTETCDADKNGLVAFLEVIRCWYLIDGDQTNTPWKPGWYDSGLLIELGEIWVYSPKTPWIKTTGGDVASQGDPTAFNMTRDLASVNPAPPGDRNSTHIVFSNGSNLNLNFSSLKNWLVGDSGNPYEVSLGKFKDYVNIHNELNKKICSTRDSATFALPNAKGVFQYNGNVIWDGVFDNTPCASGKDASVVLIDGDLNINKNFQPGRPTVVIVSGDIEIDEDVSRIDAVLIADGEIETGDNGGIDQQLIIKGSLISSSDSINLQRALGDDCTPPLKCNLNDAAEIINLDPSLFYYLSDYAGVAITTYKEERP